jgi:formylglycine-generating enzyme required for sulfatase activity
MKYLTFKYLFISAMTPIFVLLTVSSTYSQASFEIKLPAMIPLPGGCTEIGTMLMDSSDNMPREVCFDAFDISSHEVSIGEFKAFLRSTGLPATSPLLEILAHELPITNITWFEAMAYTQWLSKFTGDHYSLPSEEQWEYAAQAGNGAGTQFSWGDRVGINYANCRDCSSPWSNITVAPVGSFAANPLGLYDMHGNAAEWTRGCLHEQDEQVQRRVNGDQLSSCRIATIRGGSFRNSANRIRVWQRAGHDSTRGSDEIGFRVVRLSR